MSNEVIARLKQQYKDKKVLVVGLGLQGGGVGVAKFLCELGAKVTVTDKKNREQLADSINRLNESQIVLHLDGHRQDDFLNSDVIFKGPSVPWDLPEIIAAQKKGIPVEMELSFFSAACPAKIIGITGTRGKSTTTQMIYTLLNSFGYPVYLGGSLPDISTINYLKKLTADDFMVMELSSWALSGFHRKKISPHIAVFTSFYPDHLNYYKTMDDYLYDKQAIFQYQKQGDYFIINEIALQCFKTLKCQSEVIKYKAADFPNGLQYLKGEHNRENAAAALAVAKILKLDQTHCINIISRFKGLPFRQEVVGEKNNITFVNDTTSTTPTATIKAIEAFSDKPIYLILGGQGKNLPYDDLIKQLNKPKKIILLKGSFTDEILPILKEKFSDKITLVFDDMEKAIAQAYCLAQNNSDASYILFSPAATSFAMFNNEFHRGREFNRYVKQIIHQK